MKRTVTIHTCDRCGYEFKSQREVEMEISMGGRNQPLALGRKEFCQSCTDAFLRFLDQPQKDREIPHGVKCHLQQFDPIPDNGHQHTHTGVAGSHSHNITDDQKIDNPVDGTNLRIHESTTQAAIASAIV